MTAPQEASPVYDMGFFARQPIFTANDDLWGYGLLFRDRQESTSAGEQDQDEATRRVLAAALEPLSGGAPRVSVQFSARGIVEELPRALPRELAVADVCEKAASAPGVLEHLAALRADGYAISVNSFSGDPALAGLYAQASILWVDGLKPQAEVARLASAIRRLGAIPAIKRVESREAFDAARSLEFRLFQGYHFQQPQTVSVRRLSSNQLSRLKILQILELPDPDIPALAETIRSDVALSYRLLGFLNSPYFGLPSKVESVKQALTLLGWNQLRPWLRLVVLTDLTPPEKSSELPRHSALRARFLELASAGVADAPSQALFLMGLFSLLPAMLDVPMDKVVDQLPLSPQVREALLGHESACSAWLDLARGFERGDWDMVDRALERLGLSPVDAAMAYAQAVDWTDALFRGIG